MSHEENTIGRSSADMSPDLCVRSLFDPLNAYGREADQECQIHPTAVRCNISPHKTAKIAGSIEKPKSIANPMI